MQRLQDSVVLIFGASSGIGLAIAHAFAGEGAAVALAARREGLVQEAAARIVADGGQALSMGADVSARAQVDAVVDAAIRRFGRIDVLVNAAGTNIKQRRMDELKEADWQSVLTANLTGAFHTIQAVLPHMRAHGGGLIVQVASVSARWGDLSGASYQASKHGIVGLCYATMAEERLHGIRVSVLLPGLTDTPMIRRRPVPLPDEVIGKAMQPEDLAQACIFLAGLPARTYVPEMIVLPGALQWVGQTAI